MRMWPRCERQWAESRRDDEGVLEVQDVEEVPRSSRFAAATTSRQTTGWAAPRRRAAASIFA